LAISHHLSQLTKFLGLDSIPPRPSCVPHGMMGLLANLSPNTRRKSGCKCLNPNSQSPFTWSRTMGTMRYRRQTPFPHSIGGKEESCVTSMFFLHIICGVPCITWCPRGMAILAMPGHGQDARATRPRGMAILAMPGHGQDARATKGFWKTPNLPRAECLGGGQLRTAHHV